MPRRASNINDSIIGKLDYLGLNLDKIPTHIKNFKPLKFRIPKSYEEKQYKQYRYIPAKDIQILLTPTNKMDDIQERYKKARPLIEYLDNKSEENFIKHTMFLKMLKQFKIEEVEKVAEEQAELSKNIPFKIKFEGNYLWQVYYSEMTDRYFMLVPTEYSDTSTFFYLLKKQLERGKTGKVFVPIRNAEYSNEILKKSEIEDLENYMWLFTKDWPLIYEVCDKNDELSINIVGEAHVYEKIKSNYKIKLTDKVKATQFYKILKAMFILQTELPHYFEFKTNISRAGELEFYIEDRKIEYSDILTWIHEEMLVGEDKCEATQNLIEEDNKKLEQLKIEIASQEIEYLAKEKQISTFLECKKTFFGKFKYYFKYNGKGKKNKVKKSVIEEEPIEEIDTIQEQTVKTRKRRKKGNYTIEDIIELYKELENKENELKNLVMDINSLKLKRKNMQKKIENATAFIDEIDSHKRSIFEFWKYSNKDEVATLPEGEAEEVNIIKKITKVFDYEEDIEKFGKTMDEMQRNLLSKDETDSIYLTTTNLLPILNMVKNNDVMPKNIENNLKQMKKQAIAEKTLLSKEDFDIFGSISQDTTKVSKIKNKKHRELPKDKFSILEISKNTRQIGYKLSLEKAVKNIQSALEKTVITEDIPIYKAIDEEKINHNDINIFNINPEKEIDEVLKNSSSKINFYKINLKEGTNAVDYTNIIFYDNKNRTLPVGQDLSSKILVDTSKLKLKLKDKSVFRVIQFERENDDFSKTIIKTIHVFEYDIKE